MASPKFAFASRAKPISSGGDAARIEAAFAAEERAGHRRGFITRSVALIVIAVWLGLQNRWPDMLYYHAILVIFFLLGAAPLVLQRLGLARPWQKYLFPLLDLSLFTFAVVVPSPWEIPGLPLALRLRLENVLYVFIFLAGSLSGYSPKVVLWTGFCAAATWSAGTLWIAAQTGIIEGSEQLYALPAPELATVMTDPTRVHIGLLQTQVLLILIVAGILATIVWRVRLLVERQARAERARSNLARHFSPNMVDRLSAMDDPFARVANLNVAVMFADIVGFTRMAASMTPEQTIEVLRDVHSRLATAIFEHGGTLDKYLGDGVMATFGTPRNTDRDAANALNAARAMLRAIDELNRQRRLLSQASIDLAVGIHYGPVTLGNIGNGSRLEYAVVGDTVNVAQRLEQLNRPLAAQICVSEALIAALREQDPGAAEAVADLRPLPPQELHGVDRPPSIRILPRPVSVDAMARSSVR